MSNYDDQNYDQQQPVRHRRSDRHRQESAPVEIQTPAYSMPQREEPQEIQWQRRQVDTWPEETAAQQEPQPRRRRDGYRDEENYMPRPRISEEEEEDEDEEEPSVPWLRILIAAAAAVLVFSIALFFMTDAGPLNGVRNAIVGLVGAKSKAPGEVISFQAASGTASTNSRVLFNVTTNQSVDGVRIEDEAGEEIACTATLVNGANETNKIWNLTAIFDQAYSGDVFVVIRDGDEWKRTGKSVSMIIIEPTPVPTETPLPTQVPLVTVAAETAAPTPFVPEAEVTESPTDANVIIWAQTNSPQPTEILKEEATEAPTQAPTAPPTEAPTQGPTPGPTMAPTATPLPRLSASAASGGLKVTDIVYVKGKKNNDFKRETGYVATHPDQYGHYSHMGVITFRGDNFRRNAAYGTVNVESESLSVLWQTPVGYLRTADSGTLYGVGWTGQPAIVRWTREVRQGMNLYEEKKDSVLTEVIFGAQDGKIYFLDLKDGTPTRDTINVGFPLKGSVAIDSMDRPLLAVGQGISKLPSKTGTIGLHLYNLIDGKEAYFLNGRKSDSQTQYSTNGAFDGTALFLFNGDTRVDAMIVAGENGLLYTVDLNGNFTYPNVDNPDAELTLSIKPTVTYLQTKASDEDGSLVNVESSVAMYDRYVYMADTYGVVRCVDSDTMKTVWAVDGGDNTDASIALDMDGENVALYTGNTAYNRLGTKKDVTIRRLDALTGAEIWAYNIKCDKDKNQLSGCKASPVVGQRGISNLVIFTVNMVEGGGSKILALNKENGQVVWEHALTDQAISSPVAVYNPQGKAWIIQGDQGGNLTMLNGQTGAVCSTLNLGGAIEGSPAVYNDTLVVGTCSKDNANMYGIRIQ